MFFLHIFVLKMSPYKSGFAYEREILGCLNNK